MFTGKGVFRRGPAGAGVRVPVRDLHAGVHHLPSGPVEDGQAAGRGVAGGRGWSGRRSDRVQKHEEHGDTCNGRGSKSGSVSPPSQKTQRVMSEIMGSHCFAIFLCFTVKLSTGLDFTQAKMAFISLFIFTVVLNFWYVWQYYTAYLSYCQQIIGPKSRITYCICCEANVWFSLFLCTIELYINTQAEMSHIVVLGDVFIHYGERGHCSFILSQFHVINTH